MRVRRLAAALGAVATLLAAAGITAAAQADTPPVTVTLDSPAAGATVSGSALQVTYTITTAPGEVLSETSAKFVNSQQTPYVGASSCESGCTVSVTFDTTAVPMAPSSPFAASYADGPQTLTLSANTTDGQSTLVDIGLVLDNQRPSESLGAPQPDPQTSSIWQYTATDHFHLQAYPTANDGGSVAAMTFHYMVNGAQQTAALSPPAHVGGPWTLDLDSSSWPAGAMSDWVNTTDDRGVSSIGTMVYTVVDHGFSLTGPALSGTVDDFTLDNVSLGYSFPSGETDTFPVQVTTYLDGTVVEQHALPVIYPSDPPGTITAHSGERIPGGVHDLRYVVVDNRGVSEQVDYHLTVTSTLAVAWTSGPGARVLPGSVTLSGTAMTIDTQVAGWMFYLDGRLLTSWTCTKIVCPIQVDANGTGQAYMPGQHRIRLEVAPEDGLPVTVTGTLTVLPYAHTDLARHRPVTYGHAFTLVGHATVTGGAPAPGATIILQRRPASGGSWVRVATGTANSTGTVRFGVRAGRSARYRTLTQTDPTRWAGRPGTARTVVSRAAIRLTHRPTSGTLGQYATIRGVVAPARPRAWVYLQQYWHNQWGNDVRARTGADGSFRIRWRLVHRGKIKVRLFRPAAGGLINTHTTPWLITAS